MKHYLRICITLYFIMCGTGFIFSQDYFQYIEWFTEDVTTFNTQLSSSMAHRIPVMANLGSIDSSTNMGGHLFTAGLSIGSAFTPDFFTSLTDGVTYHLIDVTDDMDIKNDLNYLPLPVYNIYGKVRTFTNWDLSARINFVPSFETENFKFSSAFSLNVALNRSLIKLGDFAGVSIAPFFTYTNGTVSYLPNKIVVPFSVLGEDFRLEGQPEIKLNWALYSFGAEAKVSTNLLFFHPFGGATAYTNAGSTSVSTNPTIEIWKADPETLLLRTNLDLGEVEGKPEAFQASLFGGFEISAAIVKLGIRIDYELVTSALAAQLGFRILF